MFYPGDPTEERKRQLIQRLSGQRRGGAGGFGQRVARAPGFFGRGQQFGGNAGQGIAQRLAAVGGTPFQGPQAPSMPAFHPSGPGSFTTSNGDYFNDVVPPSAFGPSPAFQPPSFSPHPALDPANLQLLLGGYGSQRFGSGGGRFFAS